MRTTSLLNVGPITGCGDDTGGRTERCRAAARVRRVSARTVATLSDRDMCKALLRWRSLYSDLTALARSTRSAIRDGSVPAAMHATNVVRSDATMSPTGV